MTALLLLLAGAALGASLGWHLSQKVAAKRAAEVRSAHDGTHPIFRLLHWADASRGSRHVEVKRWRFGGNWEVRLWDSDSGNHRSMAFTGATPGDAAEKAADATEGGGW